MKSSKKLVKPSGTMTVPLSPLDALRKGAPANVKFSVSRGARSKKQTGANFHTGTGNLNRMVSDMFPTTTKAERIIIRDNIERYAETKNNGNLPEFSTIMKLADGIV